MGDSVTVVLPQGYSDTEFVQANADLLEGDLMSVAYRPIEADPGSSNIQVMLDAFEASGIQINDYAIQGWLGAQLAAEGIIAAGPQFDRASVVAATNTFTEWTNKGMTPTVDWSTAHNCAGRGRSSPVLLVRTSGSPTAPSRWHPTPHCRGTASTCRCPSGPSRPRPTSTRARPDR